MYRLSSFGTVFFVLLASSLTFADDEIVGNEKKTKVINHWLEVCLERAQSYRISPRDEVDTAYKMLPEPVFKHTQVVRPPADDIGSLHLWVDEDKRPAVLGCVFCWSKDASRRMLVQEFYSLCDSPITTKVGDERVWTCSVAGTDWRPIPDAPTPKASPRRRNLQAKQMASKFSGFMMDGGNKRWQLRRVTTPIYEYQSKSDPTQGGALFAFCRATDVEAVLLVETRKHNGELQWHYTCGQFTDNEPHLFFGEKEIWTARRDSHSADGKPHFLRMIRYVEKPQIEIDAQQ